MRTQDIIDQLEKFAAFKTVAECGSIRKASEVMNIAQPSLSVKIQNLEDALSLKLLERHRKGVLLTKEGQLVLDFANDLFDRSEELRKTLVEESLQKF